MKHALGLPRARALSVPVARSLTLALMLALCSGLLPGTAHAQLTLTDDAGNTVTLPRPAERIVSLAPHVTEVLFAAGAGSKVVGVVAHSDYPPEALQLPQVGSHVRVNLEAVAALKPDLVVAWKSGNRDTHLERFAALGIPVYINEPRSLEAIARSLEQFGRLAGTEATAQTAAAAFRQRHAELAARYRARPPVRLFYQIWNQPLMTINDEQVISDAIRLCGGVNVFGSLAQLAPRVNTEAVLAANPEAIIASGMADARPEWLDQWRRWPNLAASAANNLFFIPPDLIQRHTPRLLEGAARLCEQLETVRAKRTQGATRP